MPEQRFEVDELITHHTGMVFVVRRVLAADYMIECVNGTDSEMARGVWEAHADYAHKNFKRRAETVRHVQRSQVWEGSRGRAKTFVHAHLAGTFTARHGRRTTIKRDQSTSLCNRAPWYANDPAGDEHRCPECERLAHRYGIDWPITPSEGGERG